MFPSFLQDLRKHEHELRRTEKKGTVRIRKKDLSIGYSQGSVVVISNTGCPFFHYNREI